MKKRTNTVLLGAFVLVLVVITGVIFTARGILSRGLEDARTIELSGRRVDRSFDTGAFTRIESTGGWRLEVRRGADTSISVSGDSVLVDAADVEVEGGTLRLRAEGVAAPFHGGLRAEIALPTLEALRTTGGSDVRLSGFSQGALTIENHGAGNLEAAQLEVDDLLIRSQGAANFDFSSARVHSAEIFLEGAGNVELTMTGGELTGRISGLGNVEYRGQISRESLRVDGLGSVERKHER